ncbi:hypothetical protein PVAND_014226 [Polypedilum vanderplanki]|uniref:Uncharacterized protein n=1 Tax=Polypedilum vanderplanki TaxID=319348 RepID=A0A9J6CSZ1_POLVA|nr:hypothetical protein PVAND_014226 [Polypedilum vanderplanki]
MGHVKQKKSTSSSTQPEALTIEVSKKDNASQPPPSSQQHYHRENRYPEQLNAEELISQINCSRNSNIINNYNEITTTTTTNNNSNRNNNDNNNNSNNAIHRTNQQQCSQNESEDVEKGTERRNSHRQKPLFRRLYSFIRNLWIGAKFNVGKAGE